MRRAALLIALAACSRSKEPASEPPPASKDAAAPSYQPGGERPPNPRRPGPVAGMLADALPVGAQAPGVDLPATGGRFELGDALTKTERVVLVFYRGDW